MAALLQADKQCAQRTIENNGQRLNLLVYKRFLAPVARLFELFKKGLP
jgi:hypothetical protein